MQDRQSAFSHVEERERKEKKNVSSIDLECDIDDSSSVLRGKYWTTEKKTTKDFI